MVIILVGMILVVSCSAALALWAWPSPVGRASARYAPVPPPVRALPAVLAAFFCLLGIVILLPLAFSSSAVQDATWQITWLVAGGLFVALLLAGAIYALREEHTDR